MTHSIFPPNRQSELALLALQAFQVLFLWLHDWVPLGKLNDVAAVRRQDSLAQLVRVTLIQSIPFTIGFLFSLRFGLPYPHWLYLWLCISYSLIFLGQMRAWWVPYLLSAEPERAARYRNMFGHTFLPAQAQPNGAEHGAHLTAYCDGGYTRGSIRLMIVTE